MTVIPLTGAASSAEPPGAGRNRGTDTGSCAAPWAGPLAAFASGGLAAFASGGLGGAEGAGGFEGAATLPEGASPGEDSGEEHREEAEPAEEPPPLCGSPRGPSGEGKAPRGPTGEGKAFGEALACRRASASSATFLRSSAATRCTVFRTHL